MFLPKSSIFGLQVGRSLCICLSLLLLPVVFALSVFQSLTLQTDTWICCAWTIPVLNPARSHFVLFPWHPEEVFLPGNYTPSLPGATDAQCGWHGAIVCSTCLLPSGDMRLRSKGSRQEALESSCFSSIPRDFLAELPCVNGFCPCNSQPGKLYVCGRAGKLARFRKR